MIGKTGELLTLSRVAKSLPGAKGATNLSPSTLTRWILVGCPGVTGERIKLKATRAGGRWLVTADDLEIFFDALAERPITAQLPNAPRIESDDKRRAEQIRKIGERLEKKGA